MAQKSNLYVVVDFSNVTESGFNKLIESLKENDCTVDNVISTNRSTLKDNHQLKKAVFCFNNGQTMTLLINESGTIYQLMMNKKRYPTPEETTLSGLATSIATDLKKNQKSFDAALAKKMGNIPTATSGVKPIKRTVQIRLNEANQRLASAKNESEKLLSELNDKNKVISDSQSQINKLQKTLNAEKEKTVSLKNELEILTK